MHSWTVRYNFMNLIVNVISNHCWALIQGHLLCAVDFSVSDGADERHNLAVVKKQTHEGNGGFLFLSTHLPQSVSCGRRYRLDREEQSQHVPFKQWGVKMLQETLVYTHLYISGVQQQISEGGVVFGGEHVVLGVNDVQTQRAKLFHLHRLPSVLPGLKKVPEGENIQKIRPTVLLTDGIVMDGRQLSYLLQPLNSANT